MTDQNRLKHESAVRAVQFIKSGMVLGLGSGSTMRFALEEIGRLLKSGELCDIVGIPTSEATASIARSLDIPLTTLEEHPQTDLNIDGADEIDPQLNLIKGLGGALLREKIVASAAPAFVVVADSSKIVSKLGSKAPIPIEVIKMARSQVERKLLANGGSVRQRMNADGSAYLTDEGNHILDYFIGPMDDPYAVAALLDGMTGVVEHGLFLGMATSAVVALPDRVELLSKS
jgi:ribose 5-phosphate isomerase A